MNRPPSSLSLQSLSRVDLQPFDDPIEGCRPLVDDGNLFGPQDDAIGAGRGIDILRQWRAAGQTIPLGDQSGSSERDVVVILNRAVFALLVTVPI